MKDLFDASVRRQIERLKTSSCQEIERQVAEKRMAWFKRLPTASVDPPSPRRAYELLFLDYMGLSTDDLSIVSETETEIVWLSRNRCPTLEVCQALGLDTRHVCRAAYEKSTQTLVSQLDPQLRFLRSYSEIRPHADHCREWIVRVDFEAMMALALEEAQAGKREGNQGYGAVVALGNRIVGRAHDTAVAEQDSGLHAEVNAIQQAARTLGDPNLSGAILFTTCEPCPMCASLVVRANLTTIVYGASIEETAQLGRSRALSRAKGIVDRSPTLVEVIGGVFADECRLLYT